MNLLLVPLLAPNVWLYLSSVSALAMTHTHQTARRFVPIAPALPNGIKDVPVVSKDDHVSDPRYQGQR